jgi:hypothetical protein
MRRTTGHGGGIGWEGGTEFPDAQYGLDPSGWGAGDGGAASHRDCSASPVPVDPYKSVQWDIKDVTTIPSGSMKFSTDQTFVTKKHIMPHWQALNFSYTWSFH